MAEREKIVDKFVAETRFDWPILLDNERNEFDKIYASWPLRFYLVGLDGSLKFIAEPEGGGFYDLGEIDQELTKVLNK